MSAKKEIFHGKILNVYPKTGLILCQKGARYKGIIMTYVPFKHKGGITEGEKVRFQIKSSPTQTFAEIVEPKSQKKKKKSSFVRRHSRRF